AGVLRAGARVAGVRRPAGPVPQLGRDGPGLALAQPRQPGLVAVPLGQPEGVPGTLAVPDEPEDLRAPDHDGLECRLFVKDQLNYRPLWQASSIFSAWIDSMTGMKAE